MGDRAFIKRESCAEKLEGSMRQLRQYIGTAKPIPRLVQLKIDKVEVDREELIASHHQYGEKSDTSITNEEMREYINPKTDNAVDLVDEALILIETLNSEKNVEERNVKLRAAKIEAKSCYESIKVTVNNLDEHIKTEDPVEANALFVESTLKEIQTREDQLLMSWNK